MPQGPEYSSSRRHFEEKIQVDIKAARAEISRLKGELAVVEKQMDDYLKEQGF